MSKKVSELFDKLNCEWLETIDVEDESIPESVSLERIKHKALEGIKENKVCPLRQKDIQHKKYKKKKRSMIMPLVAAVALMGITVIAVNSNEHLRGVIGVALPFIQSEVQSIDQTMTHKGVAFTAEAAAIENKAGLFYLSAAHADGSDFVEGTEFRRIAPRTEKRGGVGWVVETMLSDDKKKVVSVVDLSGSKNLYNQRIRFTAYDLGIWQEGEVEVPIDLEGAYKESMVRSGESLQIQPIAGYKDYTIDNILFEDEKLQIVTSAPSPNGERLLDREHITLIDTRTGDLVASNGGSGNWDQEKQRDEWCNRFVGVAPEDLAFLQMKIEYRYFEPEVVGEWSVDFELDKNQNVKEKKVLKRIKNDAIDVTVYDIDVSKLGVKIEGLRHKGSSDAVQGYVQMKDGSRVELIHSGSWGKLNLFFGRQYKYGNLIEGDNLPLNMKSNVKASGEDRITQGIAVSSIARTTRKTSQAEEVPNVIELSNIESIVLEGVTIPIQ